MKLYELAEAYRSIEALMQEEGDGWEKALDDTREEIGVKLVNIAKLVREIEAEGKAYQAEANRMTAHFQSAVNRVDRLKAYAQTHMEALGLDKVQGDVIGLRLQKGPPQVEVVSEGLIPSNFIRGTIIRPLNELPEELQTEAIRAVDKRAILDVLKSGASVPGTEVVQRKHLRIV